METVRDECVERVGGEAGVVVFGGGSLGGG